MAWNIKTWTIYADLAIPVVKIRKLAFNMGHSIELIWNVLVLTHAVIMTTYGESKVPRPLAQVLAGCLPASSHYLDQCFLINRLIYLSISQEVFKIPNDLKSALLKLLPHPQRSNELTRREVTSTLHFENTVHLKRLPRFVLCCVLLLPANVRQLMNTVQNLAVDEIMHKI